jgi:hypothetical protein
MMDRKILLVGLFALVLAVAGCTAPGQSTDEDDSNNAELEVTQNDGLSVTFGSQASQYYTDASNAVLEATMKNTGEADANILSAQLFGASWASGTSCQGCSGVTLRGVERANNLDGEQRSFTFTPPLNVNLDQGQSDTYRVGLRLRYNYEAETRSKLTLMSREEYRQNQPARTRMQNDVSAGPLQLSFTGKTPFPVRDNQQITVPVKVNNVGDGDIEDETIRLLVETEGGEVLEECHATASGGYVGKEMQVFDGQRTFNCRLNTSSFNPNPEQTVTIIATANYNYVEDTSTSVRVVGAG